MINAAVAVEDGSVSVNNSLKNVHSSPVIQ